MLKPRFQRELPTLLNTTADAVSQLLGARCTFEAIRNETGAFSVIAPGDALAAAKPGAVCCRCAYGKKGTGNGGLLIPERAALHLARLAMFMAPPTVNDTFEFAGSVSDAVSEVWNVMIAAWNQGADPDCRLSSKPELRAAEHYPATLPFPEEAGVFPTALRVAATLNDHSFETTWFLPSSALSVAPRGWTPTEFVMRTVAAPVAAPVVAQAVTEEVPTVPAASAAVADGMVFIDPTGFVLQMIRTAARHGMIEIVNSEEVGDAAAVVATGAAAIEAAAAQGHKTVTIHPKGKQGPAENEAQQKAATH